MISQRRIHALGIAQRKRAIPHSTMKTNRDIQNSGHCNSVNYLGYSKMSVNDDDDDDDPFVVVMRSVISPKLSLRTSVTTSRVTCFVLGKILAGSHSFV